MPTIKIKSNWHRVRKNIESLSKQIDTEVQAAMQEILENMCKEMKAKLASGSQYWMDNGGLEAVYNASGNQDIEYEIVDNKGVLYVGRNTSRLIMEDGRVVNPYLFIEFGYGIIGENSPHPKAYLENWDYNVNNHEKAWWFVGINGERTWTMGQKGFDFFYPILDKYKKEWKNIVSKRILKLQTTFMR